MIWARLKDMLCPACRSPLIWSALDGRFNCTKTLRKACEFGIDEEAFNRTVSGLYTPRQRARIPSEEDNLSALNNLGHAVPSEDYSDQL